MWKIRAPSWKKSYPIKVLVLLFYTMSKKLKQQKNRKGIRVNLGKEVSYFFIMVKFWISKIIENWDLVDYQKEDSFIDDLLQATNSLPQLSIST